MARPNIPNQVMSQIQHVSQRPPQSQNIPSSAPRAVEDFTKRPMGPFYKIDRPSALADSVNIPPSTLVYYTKSLQGRLAREALEDAAAFMKEVGEEKFGELVETIRELLEDTNEDGNQDRNEQDGEDGSGDADRGKGEDNEEGEDSEAGKGREEDKGEEKEPVEDRDDE